MEKRGRINRFWIITSSFGVCLFILLYFIAASLYPGGSQADKTTSTFSWVNNYWCDLLSERAKNGQNNSARLIAVLSWVILCFSISVFWYFLPQLLLLTAKGKKTIRVCGIGAMMVAVFLFTSLHDVVIQVGGVLGFIAFIITFAGFYKNRMYGLFYTGLFCVALMGLNYYIMVAGGLSFYLPVVQKITFIIVLLWILFVNRKLYRQIKEPLP